MSVPKLGDQFCSYLHVRHMKALGFKKRGRSYCRDREGYTECVSIQGSSWNSGEEPWHFYVNISVAFVDVPFKPDSGLKYHADGRLERLALTAPPAYDLMANNFEQLADELVVNIKHACEVIPKALSAIRTRALEGFYSPLPVPESWVNERKT